jgi:hypothetical protein
MELLGLALLILISVPVVSVVRHREENLLAAYMIFTVAFSTIAGATFFTLVNASQRWPEAAASNFILSPAGIMLLSILPAYCLGLWTASRPPYKSPHLE